MSNSLYLEAVKAAEQLKMSAEEKAKQQIIESMAPQIKLMVEKKLMGDEDEKVLTDKEEESDTNDCDTEKSDERGATYASSTESVNEITLDEDARRVLSTFITNKAKAEAIQEKIKDLKEGLKTLQKARILAEGDKKTVASRKKINTLFKKIVVETKNIKNNKIVRNNKQILKEYYELIKELNTMSRRRNRVIEESLEDLLEMNLFEEEGDDQEGEEKDFLAGLEDDDMPEPEDSEEEEDAPADDAEDMQISKDTTVEQLAAMVGLGGEEAGEEEEELDLEGIFEGPEDGEEEEDDETNDSLSAGVYESRNRVLEIDENMLRREIGRMKTLREGEAKDMASHFGGGSLEGEMFVDGVELNKLHEMKIKAAKVVRKNRMLESKLSQYKKALRGMKTQLTEMNLFNAKLLYANKLMQNRDLSIKQQRNIVESLDEAKTLGEAKILFESLSKSLVSGNKNQRSGNLQEGAIRRRSGSSSAPVRSAQTLNESVALDRWATLAGIKN